MTRSTGNIASQIFRMRGRKTSVVILLWANYILLGVNWGMSLRTYLRLPGRMAWWPSVWKGAPAFVEKSCLFFIYPLIQTVVILGGMALAGRFFVRRSDGKDVANLKVEMIHLVLIFISLVFIHLQTSLIFVSFGMGSGIKKPYLGVILAVLIMLVPYYCMRRRMLARPR